MENLPVKAQNQALSKPSSRLSPEGLSKALRVFAKCEPVTVHTRLVELESLHRLVATVDADLVPCTRDEATTFVATLLGAYPDARAQLSAGAAEFKLYTNHLFDAFQQFSAVIGREIVHGGTGLPAASPFKPKPADVVAFGKALVDKRIIARAMALSQIAEHKRRAEERDEGPTPEERARVLAGFAKLTASLKSMEAV